MSDEREERIWRAIFERDLQVLGEPDTMNVDPGRLKQQLSHAEMRIANQTGTIDILRGERDALATALREREQQLREKVTENKELRRLLEEVGLDRAGIAGELSAVEQQLSEAREALAAANDALEWIRDVALAKALNEDRRPDRSDLLLLAQHAETALGGGHVLGAALGEGAKG